MIQRPAGSLALALLVLATGACPVGGATSARADARPPDLVVSETNGTTNEVLVSERDADGRLTVVQRLATGGAGTGAYLHTSGAVARLGTDRVLVVNAGSDTVTVLVREDGRLRVQSTFPAGGTTPTSIAVAGDRVYVMSTGIPSENEPDPTPRLAAPLVQGFHVDADGRATPIPGAWALLPGACPSYPCEASTIFAQVAASPDGRALMVTASSRHRLLTWAIEADGSLRSLPGVTATVPGPYGLAWARSGTAVVVGSRGPRSMAEAMSGTVGAAGWQHVTASVATGQSGACWAALSPAEDRAYIIDAGTLDPSDPSPGITTMALGRDGELAILGATDVPWDLDRFPADAATSTDGRTLYAVSNVGYYVFDIDDDGIATYAPAKEVLTAESELGPGATGLVVLPSA